MAFQKELIFQLLGLGYKKMNFNKCDYNMVLKIFSFHELNDTLELINEFMSNQHLN